MHPLVGLEPTYAPGRPNRQLIFLNRANQAWSQQNSPPLYHYLDNYHYQHTRIASAPPTYRARDDLDFYEGLDMSREHWQNEGHDLDFWIEHENYTLGQLEYRSQDWLSMDDERFYLDEPWFPTPWRTLRAIANRQYTGAGMFGQP